MKVTVFQFMRFTIVGATNTVLDAFIYIALTRSTDFFHRWYLLAAAIAFFLSSANSFFWNKHWTFKDGIHYSHAQLMRFFMVAGVAFFLNEILLWLCVEFFHVHDIVAKLLASIGAGGINFLMQKFWTFPIVDYEGGVGDEEKSEYTSHI
ncbi:MAG: GtrA family protein [Candidatus Kerfeldbacteria bacterium]|nr:GtrA family protein [Candidatus Kerfeldbacteria bacterium]